MPAPTYTIPTIPVRITCPSDATPRFLFDIPAETNPTVVTGLLRDRGVHIAWANLTLRGFTARYVMTRDSGIYLEVAAEREVPQ